MPYDRALRLATDVGGTFTDTVLMAGSDEIRATAKSLTTHENPALGALEGVARALAQADAPLSAVAGFIHGTTLATNALLERRGARVATITTEGFRDILEIAYERRYSQYDIDLIKPDLLVPRDLAFTAKERVDVHGRVLIPLDETCVVPLLAALDAASVEAVAICLLHAYANPVHERRLAELLQQARPDLVISISSDVSPEAREFDRLCTTVANAYIQPLMSGYLNRFEAAFREKGLTCPILMMTAGGGMTTLETAARLPIRLVESGPAGGAILAAQTARAAGITRALSFDMGGTTAKLCLIDDATPQTSRQFEIGRAARFIKGSGMPVRIPVIEMIEIGAGGGSIADIDSLGRLTVGPKSAGSEPGPVAFQRGGTAPTVTDADVALGYIRPETFADAQFTLDAEAAREAIAARLAPPLETTGTGAADGVSRIVDESMASAARAHAVESGKDITERTMIAFGGNGPLHACRVARSAGVARVLIPPNPSVGSAVGFLHAPISFEIVRSRYTLLTGMDFAAVDALFSEMVEQATGVVRQGSRDGPLEISRQAFMRYKGQGHEIEIALPDRALGPADLLDLTMAFEAAYAAQFSRAVPGMEIEVLNWAVSVSTLSRPVTTVPETPRTRPFKPTETVQIHCEVTSQPAQAARVDRTSLLPGHRLQGPALIVEPQTTTFVGADFELCVDGALNLILTRKPKL
ncbi:MAG: hydantoinase/oxoprolinase family protein [Pseudomonadota bacterium]